MWNQHVNNAVSYESRESTLSLDVFMDNIKLTVTLVYIIYDVLDTVQHYIKCT